MFHVKKFRVKRAFCLALTGNAGTKSDEDNRGNGVLDTQGTAEVWGDIADYRRHDTDTQDANDEAQIATGDIWKLSKQQTLLSLEKQYRIKIWQNCDRHVWKITHWTQLRQIWDMGQGNIEWVWYNGGCKKLGRAKLRWCFPLALLTRANITRASLIKSAISPRVSIHYGG